MPTTRVKPKYGFRHLTKGDIVRVYALNESRLDWPPYSPPRDGRTATIVRGRHGPNYKKYYPVHDGSWKWPQIKPVDPIEFTDREEYR